MSRRNAVLVGIFPLAACVSAPMQSAAGPTATIGQAALVDGIQVRPLRLIEDSRCPALVQCIWAGRVRIEAIMQSHLGSEEAVEMTLGEPISLPEGELMLSDVLPVPVAGRTIPTTAYRFTFARK